MARRPPLLPRARPEPRSSRERAQTPDGLDATLEGLDESAWLDVIQKMEQVYTQLIDDEVELEQKNAELEQQQQFIVSVLSSMSDVLVVCDRSGRIEQVNSALCACVGQAAPALLGQPLTLLLADRGSQERALAAMRALAHPGAADAAPNALIELNLRNPKGAALPVDASCSARLGAQGRRLGTVWVGRATGELKRAYQELQAAHAALKRTQQQLLHSEKMASLGQLVAGVAHELNNPISFVLGNTHALQKYCLRLQEYLQAVHSGSTPAQLTALQQSLRIDALLRDLPELIAGTLEGAQRTADIVHGLKRFSAMDKQAHAPLELCDVVERALLWVQKGWKQPPELRWQRPATALRVHGNAGQLQQVLMNLLQNAYDAVAGLEPERRWIALEGALAVPIAQSGPPPDAAAGACVLLVVEDSGRGIAPEHLARIFDPFFTTKPVGQGTGLGLSISYGIVEEHGGRLSASNRNGGGARFELSLPALAAP